MAYRLKPSTPHVYFLHRGRQRIGSVHKRGGNNEWIARVGGLVRYGNSAREAFEAIVTTLNRIEICGEDDPDKARAELSKRNAQVQREIDEFNAKLGFDMIKVRRSRGFKL